MLLNDEKPLGHHRLIRKRKKSVYNVDVLIALKLKRTRVGQNRHDEGD